MSSRLILFAHIYNFLIYITSSSSSINRSLVQIQNILNLSFNISFCKSTFTLERIRGVNWCTVGIKTNYRLSSEELKSYYSLERPLNAGDSFFDLEYHLSIFVLHSSFRRIINLWQESIVLE